MDKNILKTFFNLRKNENQYGDNMRDLLHMYDDDNLEKNIQFRIVQNGRKNESN